MNKNELFEHIVEFYLNSGDFNGIPMYCLPSYNPEDMVELINEGLVETISESETINPHIKGFEFELTTDQHVSNAAGKNGQVCFYPTKKALESTAVEHSKPYTALLQKGRAQFDIIFFDIEVLESARKDRRSGRCGPEPMGFFKIFFPKRSTMCALRHTWTRPQSLMETCMCLGPHAVLTFRTLHPCS